MGTWGIGPFDNDEAADMVGSLMEQVTRVAYGRRGGYYCKARAAAQFVFASHGTDILGGPSLGPVVRALARMRMDSEWLAGWDDPKKIARVLDAELKTVIDRMHVCNGCHKSIPKTEWRELDALVETAMRRSVPKLERPNRKPSRTARAAVRKILNVKAPASRRS